MRTRKSTRSGRHLFFLLCLGLTTASCSLGPSRLAPARLDYNQAIAKSWDEQLLLNLVRLRYRDTPIFLELSSVVSQFEYIASSQLSGIFPGKGRHSYSGVLGMHFSEAPTVTYSPLQGETFARRLLAPISPETIVLLSRSGWSIERLLNLCIHSVNGLENAPRAAGPTPEEPPNYQAFQNLSRLLRDMQVAKELEVRLHRTRNEGVDVLLVVEEGANANRLRSSLGLSSESTELTVTSRESASGESELAVKGRSLLGAMFFLSQGVEPPDEHAAQGLVTITKTPSNDVFDWKEALGSLVTIRSSQARPSRAAVAVPYRGHWFFIEDNDLNSKTTFNLMTYIFSLQATDEKKESPLLTVPLGR